MDDKKDEKPIENPPADEPEPADGKHHLTESVGNLITSTAGAIAETVKDAASSIVQLAKTPPVISGRIETAHPPVEENFDAPPMTAEEIAEHAAAETQPVAIAKREKRKKVSAKRTASKKAALPKESAAKKAVKTSAKKTRKAVSKKRSKKLAKKSTKKVSKKAPKKMPKTKSKKAKRSKR